jgi:hypothetical protein
LIQVIAGKSFHEASAGTSHSLNWVFFNILDKRLAQLTDVRVNCALVDPYTIPRS